MHWWHAAQFALWDRLPLLERSLGYYDAHPAEGAEATAARQGYAGARWPKMTSPSGRRVAVERRAVPRLAAAAPDLLRGAGLPRERRDRATLERFRDVVFETAEFMASFPAWDAHRRSATCSARRCSARRRCIPKDRTTQLHLRAELLALGPGDGAGLARAPRPAARAALGSGAARALRRRPSRTASTSSPRARPTRTRTRAGPRDHPSVVAALGVLPGPGVDRDTMARTFDWIWANWNWPTRGAGTTRCWP